MWGRGQRLPQTAVAGGWAMAERIPGFGDAPHPGCGRWHVDERTCVLPARRTIPGKTLCGGKQWGNGIAEPDCRPGYGADGPRRISMSNGHGNERGDRPGEACDAAVRKRNGRAAGC